MVGKVYLSVVEYYDSKTKTTRKKGRPVLVVAGPRNNDYTVLPIPPLSGGSTWIQTMISPSKRTSGPGWLSVKNASYVHINRRPYIWVH